QLGSPNAVRRAATDVYAAQLEWIAAREIVDSAACGEGELEACFAQQLQRAARIVSLRIGEHRGYVAEPLLQIGPRPEDFILSVSRSDLCQASVGAGVRSERQPGAAQCAELLPGQHAGGVRRLVTQLAADALDREQNVGVWAQ